MTKAFKAWYREQSVKDSIWDCYDKFRKLFSKTIAEKRDAHMREKRLTIYL
jgi:hypothetical protein